MVVGALAAAAVCGMLMLAGCASRPPASTPPPPPAPAAQTGVELTGIDYIDLEPGWRLRVVVPIPKSGGHELEGYETSFYALRPRVGEGVSIEFLSGETTKAGVTVPSVQPRLALFRLPPEARHVRLVFLARLSRTDHDMAVVATASRDALGGLTRAVKADPRSCADARESFCAWIPAGVGVIPELRRTVAGSEVWIPAR